MGVLNGILGSGRAARERIDPPRIQASGSLENPSTPFGTLAAPGAAWFTDGMPTVGPVVNERTSMSVSAVFRCVSLISSMIAGTPLNVYRESDKGGREIAKGHRLHPLLSLCPYPDRPMTSFIWREQWGINTLLWGNHYSLIRYDGAARVIGFVPLLPWNVTVLRLNERNVYRCIMEDGSIEWADQEDVLHIPGIGFNGVVGESRIRSFAKHSIGLAKTFAEQVARVHENAAKPSGMVTLGKTIKEGGMARLEAWFQENYTGRHNAGKPLFMDEGSSWVPFQMSPEDLQTIAFMKYENADIARFFGVPPHMIGETDGTTAWGTGIAQMTLGFRIYTMEPEFQRIEQEINSKLFANSPFFVAFDRDASLGMDALAMAQVLQTRVNSGLMTPNEGRRILRLPDMPGGDTLLVNSTIIPLSRALNPPVPAAPAHAPPAQPGPPGPPHNLVAEAALALGLDPTKESTNATA